MRLIPVLETPVTVRDNQQHLKQEAGMDALAWCGHSRVGTTGELERIEFFRSVCRGIKLGKMIDLAATLKRNAF